MLEQYTPAKLKSMSSAIFTAMNVIQYEIDKSKDGCFTESMKDTLGYLEDIRFMLEKEILK